MLGRRKNAEHLQVSALEMESESMSADNVWSFRKQKPPGAQHFKDAIEEMGQEQEALAAAGTLIPEPGMSEMPNPDGHSLPPKLKHRLAARQNMMVELLRFKDDPDPIASMQKCAEDAFNMVLEELDLPGTVTITQNAKIDEVLRQQQQTNQTLNTLMEQGKPPAP